MEPNKLYDLINELSMDDKQDDEISGMFSFGDAAEILDSVAGPVQSIGTTPNDLPSDFNLSMGTINTDDLSTILNDLETDNIVSNDNSSISPAIEDLGIDINLDSSETSRDLSIEDFDLSANIDKSQMSDDLGLIDNFDTSSMLDSSSIDDLDDIIGDLDSSGIDDLDDIIGGLDLSDTPEDNLIIEINSYVDILNYLSLTPLEKDFLEYAHTCRYSITLSNDVEEVILGTGKSAFKQDFKDKYDVIKRYIQTCYYLSIDKDILVEQVYNRDKSIFKYINYPFRKITSDEIRTILNVYDKDWYIDYVLPLFSIAPENTNILVDVMEQGRFNKELFLYYIENEQVYSSFLRLYKNNRFDKCSFDKVIDSDEINSYTDLILDYRFLPVSLIGNMFISGHGDFLISLVERYNEDVTKLLSVFEDIPGFLEYPYIAKIIQLYIENGIFNRAVLENYLFKMPNHKWLLELYKNGDPLFNIVQSQGDLYIAKFIYDCTEYGYNCNNVISGVVGNDSAFRNVVTFLIMHRYNNKIPEMDYKKWLILLCSNGEQFFPYLKLLLQNRQLPFFNKFWYSLLIEKFGYSGGLVDNMPSTFIVFTQQGPEFIRVEEIIFNIGNVLERISSVGIQSISIGAQGECIAGFYSSSVKEPGMLVINGNGDGLSFPLTYCYRSSLDNAATGICQCEDPLRYNVYKFRDTYPQGIYTMDIFNEYCTMSDNNYVMFDLPFSLMCDSDYGRITDSQVYSTFIRAIAIRMPCSLGKCNLFILIFYGLFGKYMKTDVQNPQYISEDKIYVTGRFGIKEITWNTMLLGTRNLLELLQTDHFTLVQSGGKFTLNLS